MDRSREIQETATRFATLYDNAVIRKKRELDRGGVEARQRKNGSFAFIPMSVRQIADEFLNLNELLDNKQRKYYNQATHWMYHRFAYDMKFLDAGCGIGNIMLLAKQFHIGGRQEGLEFDKATIKAAHEFLGTFTDRKFDIHHGDILTFEDYKKYDIIYYYCPFTNYVLQAYFEERLEDEVKVGTIIMPHLKRSQTIRKDSRFKPITTKGILNQTMVKVRDGKRKHSDLPHMVADKDRHSWKHLPKHYKKLVVNRAREMEDKGCFS